MRTQLETVGCKARWTEGRKQSWVSVSLVLREVEGVRRRE